MKIQNFSLLWLVAVCVTWTVMCEAAELSNQNAPRSEQMEFSIDNFSPEETGKLSEYGSMEEADEVPYVMETANEGTLPYMHVSENLLNDKTIQRIKWSRNKCLNLAAGQ